MLTDKKADLAGPGIGNYTDVEKILPTDYTSLLTPRETMQALYATKDYIEKNLCKDYFLDHDHSCYVDQWDWERVMTMDDRNVEFLKDVVRKIWKVITGAEDFAQQMFPKLKNPKYPNLPKELVFM